MKKIEFIQDNFLGMPYSNQIQVIEYLKTDLLLAFYNL